MRSVGGLLHDCDNEFRRLYGCKTKERRIAEAVRHTVTYRKKKV